jgi:hypothetical protein
MCPASEAEFGVARAAVGAFEIGAAVGSPVRADRGKGLYPIERRRPALPRGAVPDFDRHRHRRVDRRSERLWLDPEIMRGDSRRA